MPTHLGSLVDAFKEDECYAMLGVAVCWCSVPSAFEAAVGLRRAGKPPLLMPTDLFERSKLDGDKGIAQYIDDRP
eukprot:1343825-Amphidinium_carterae.1